MKISVRVQPGSSKGPLVVENGDGLKVFLRERAVDGAANQALIMLLAKHFGVAKTRIMIVHGQNSRNKIIQIQ